MLNKHSDKTQASLELSPSDEATPGKQSFFQKWTVLSRPNHLYLSQEIQGGGGRGASPVELNNSALSRVALRGTGSRARTSARPCSMLLVRGKQPAMETDSVQPGKVVKQRVVSASVIPWEGRGSPGPAGSSVQPPVTSKWNRGKIPGVGSHGTGFKPSFCPPLATGFGLPPLHVGHCEHPQSQEAASSSSKHRPEGVGATLAPHGPAVFPREGGLTSLGLDFLFCTEWGC